MGDVSPEMQRAGAVWAAQDAAEERRATERIAEELTPPAPVEPSTTAAPATPAPAAPVVVEVTSEQLEKLCGVVWNVADRLVVKFAGAELALTPAERQQLADASVPVLEQYLPVALGKWLNTPLGALAGTVGLVYGSKLLLPSTTPTAASSPAPQDTAAPAPAPAVAPAGATA